CCNRTVFDGFAASSFGRPGTRRIWVRTWGTAYAPRTWARRTTCLVRLTARGDAAAVDVAPGEEHGWRPTENYLAHAPASSALPGRQRPPKPFRPAVDETPLFSLRENAIAKEPGPSYPERWRCAPVLGASLVAQTPSSLPRMKP